MLTSFLFALSLAIAEPPVAPPPSIPAAVFVETMPKDAKSVAVVKKNAKKGEKVVMEAKIGGRGEPFLKNRAAFMVADTSLKSCNEIEGDTCPKPWDYCCETSDSKKTNMLIVQIVDAEGKLLKCDANGVHGLAPLRTIVVEGVVASVDDKGNCTINATQIWVKPQEKKS